MMLATSYITVCAAETNIPAVTSSEEFIEINVYDAESLKSYLKVENADIVLWFDVNIDDVVTACCHSIDLNGYNLTLSTLTVNSDKQSFSILDSAYDKNASSSSGSLKVRKSLNIGNTTLIVQNGIVNISNGIVGSGNVEIYDGIITVHGKNGFNGANGTSGKDGFNTLDKGGDQSPTAGTAGANGFDGDIGSHGIQVSNLYIYGGEVTVVGGNGGDGGNGGNGGDGGSDDNSYSCGNYRGGNGGNGGNAGDGGKSGIGIVVSGDIVCYFGTLSVKGGVGGSGGNGGVGGYGGIGDYPVSLNSNYPGGKGGNGGNGGNGGSNSYGGEAILATNFIIYDGHVTAIGGNEGAKGVGGSGGNGGFGGTGKGTAGTRGDNGAFYGNGGAGINANVTIYGGTVTATGGNGAAGIGGSGYTGEISGHNVNVCGGNVVVTAGSNAFDIGGGYNGTQVGNGGSLTVTGGSIEFCTASRATNVSNPTFTNCTISGNGAYQHEGTYDSNGKFSINVQNIIISPEECVGYEKVTLQAILSISRTSNISTPSPKGYILFKLDGKEIGTSDIKTPVENDTEITAIATIDWVAVEGDYIITAEYIAGTNDKYASAGIFEFEPDVTVHTHEWEDDFFVDINPTCLTAGSKSIHCKICGAQKNITEIPAIGHNYVNNQCENCKEYLPLIVFKDYDGTILSSTYYYIGDAISVPNDPTRDEDNTYTYEFIGWDKEIVECDGDKIYTAVYKSTHKNYTIIFKNWDNSIVLTKDDYHYGDVIVPPTISPTKPSDKIGDYIFAGWDSPVGTCEGDKVYIATYSTSYKYYKVEFKNWNNQTISSKNYKYGENIEIPAPPTKPTDNIGQYVFNGWDKNITVCDGDKVYIATYLIDYIDYTITFKDWDNSIISTNTYHYGDAITAPEAPTKAADNTYTYTFKGWDKTVVNCKGDATYIATYNATYINYTVTFKNEDGSLLSSKTYHYGENVVAPSTPSKVANNTYTYTFAGWDSEVVACNGNKIYTATYTPVYIKYTVVFKNWNGDVISSNVYHYGQSVTKPSDPTRAADTTYTYAFMGWDKTVVNCKGNTTYTALYNATYINYTVTFKNEDGSLLSSKTYHYGDTVVVPETPTKPADESYTYGFAGWDSEVTACLGNKTYTATFNPTKVEYTVVFKDWNGNIISSETYYFGAEVVVPENPTRNADNVYTYTFKNWGKTVAENCVGDAEYTAVYEATYIEYNIKFLDWDGSVIQTVKYHYGDTITAIADPERDSDETYTYTFLSWNKPLGTCTGNASFTAQYESTFINYTVVFKDYDGSVISRKTYHFGDTITIPADPVRASDETYTYTFKDWGNISTSCNGNKEYTAVYNSEYIEYTVVFKDHNGNTLSSKTYHYGDEVVAPSDPTRVADNTYTYTFNGWDREIVDCVANATYTATYTPTFIDYTVVFKDYDGTVLSTQTYHYGDEITAPGIPTRAEDDTYIYTFSGWDKEIVACDGNETYMATYISINKNLGVFNEKVTALVDGAVSEELYGKIYEAIQIYNTFNEEEKQEVEESYQKLLVSIEAYNAEAKVINNEQVNATEIAFAPIATTSFTFLAALWFLLKKKFFV